MKNSEEASLKKGNKISQYQTDTQEGKFSLLPTKSGDLQKSNSKLQMKKKYTYAATISDYRKHIIN